MSDWTGKAEGEWAELTAPDGTMVRLHYNAEALGFDTITLSAGETGCLSGRIWRRIPFAALERHFAGASKADDCPEVSRPNGPITDPFLAQIGMAYRWLTSAGQAPAVGIAARAGVPVRTAHRWIYLTRKRGFLPAARGRRAATSERS